MNKDIHGDQKKIKMAAAIARRSTSFCMYYLSRKQAILIFYPVKFCGVN